jgi:asparagine synthase (glutamine-hydrolysing)
LPNPAEPKFVERIDGEFCLALIDRARDRVAIANDTVASYPLYWRADGDGLVFASDLSAVLKMLPGAPRLDLRAVADYLTLGAVMGDKTLAEGVSILGPGTTLTYDVRKRRSRDRAVRAHRGVLPRQGLEQSRVF